jgi:hypothetical protein
MIQDLLGIHRRRLRLRTLHAKVGEHLLDILVLVNRYGPIDVIVELDPEERSRGAQIVQSELCLQGSLHLVDFVGVCRSNEKVIDINANDAIRFVEYTVVRLGHGEAMGSQDAVDALVPNPRSLLQSVQ